MSVEKVCGHCDKVFSVPNRRHETVKFCSRECKTLAGWATYTCMKCNSPFRRKKSDNADSERKYCSVACISASRKGLKHKVKPDAARYYKVCEVCGVNFRVTETRKDTARFCSKKCLSASPAFKQESSEAQKGDKHWRWSGGLYKNRYGYIKRNAPDDGLVAYQHRSTVLSAMLEVEPNHPFIIEVDGVKKLDPQIEVHHIDRNRSNNALQNLLAVTKHAHAQIHHRNAKPKPWECWPSNPENW